MVDITTQQIDEVIQSYRQMVEASKQCGWLKDWKMQNFFQEDLDALHYVRVPERQSEAFQVIQGIAVYALDELRMYLPELQNLDEGVDAGNREEMIVTAQQIDTIISSYERMIEASKQCAWFEEPSIAELQKNLATLHRVRKPEYRSEAISLIVEIAAHSLSELWAYLPDLQSCDERIAAQKEEIQQLEVEKTELQAENERLRRLVQQPNTMSVTFPQEQVEIRSQIQRIILQLIASEGLSRSWRIQERVIESGLTQNENSVRNGLRDLEKKGLIRDYVWKGRIVGWTPIPGGQRRLVKLTEERGESWCEEAFGQKPVPSELTVMAQKHNSVTHAVGILEARDHLRARGYQVDEEPAALLADEDNPWGKRAEPDLFVRIDGRKWPIEVQRDVREKYTLKKWNKILELAGRLVIILFNEDKLDQQLELLKLAGQGFSQGEILLASLRAMELGEWEWTKFSAWA